MNLEIKEFLEYLGVVYGILLFCFVAALFVIFFFEPVFAEVEPWNDSINATDIDIEKLLCPNPEYPYYWGITHQCFRQNPLIIPLDLSNKTKYETTEKTNNVINLYNEVSEPIKNEMFEKDCIQSGGYISGDFCIKASSGSDFSFDDTITLPDGTVVNLTDFETITDDYAGYETLQAWCDANGYEEGYICARSCSSIGCYMWLENTDGEKIADYPKKETPDNIDEIIPEFGTIAAMILAVAIISIIAVSAKSRLNITPKY